MKEDYIKLDFANGKIEVHNGSETGTIDIPDLSEKRAAVYAAVDLELVDGNELRSDIKGLFQSLGLDIEI